MISQSESGKLIADISYKYIANRETEQMNVMINMNFDRTFWICFSIKYRVTIK